MTKLEFRDTDAEETERAIEAAAAPEKGAEPVADQPTVTVLAPAAERTISEKRCVDQALTGAPSCRPRRIKAATMLPSSPPLAALHEGPHALKKPVIKWEAIPRRTAVDIIGVEGTNLAKIGRETGALLTVHESNNEIKVEIKGTKLQVKDAKLDLGVLRKKQYLKRSRVNWGDGNVVIPETNKNQRAVVNKWKRTSHRQDQALTATAVKAIEPKLFEPSKLPHEGESSSLVQVPPQHNAMATDTQPHVSSSGPGFGVETQAKSVYYLRSSSSSSSPSPLVGFAFPSSSSPSPTFGSLFPSTTFGTSSLFGTVPSSSSSSCLVGSSSPISNFSFANPTTSTSLQSSSTASSTTTVTTYGPVTSSSLPPTTTTSAAGTSSTSFLGGFQTPANSSLFGEISLVPPELPQVQPKRSMSLFEEELLGVFKRTADKMNEQEASSKPTFEDCEKKLNELGWPQNDPLHEVALAIFCDKNDNYRECWMKLSPERCANWVRVIGRSQNML